jgi:hypothetical protein
MARRPKMPRPSCLVRRRQQPDSFAETRHLKARKEKKGRPNCKQAVAGEVPLLDQVDR